jgi:hypothetical protein
MVLRAAQRLHALAVRRAAFVDRFGDGGGADEADRRDAGMREDRLDRFAPPCTTVNTPSGSPASFSSAASFSDTDGSFSDGFRMKQLPWRAPPGSSTAAP